MVFFVLTVLVLLSAKYGTGADCPFIYRSVGTVCGTDGLTYPTLCEMEIARIFDDSLDIAYFGKCLTYCKNHWNPVCGTDLRTYPNICELEHTAKKHDRLEILHMGQCRASDEEYDTDYKKKRALQLKNAGLVGFLPHLPIKYILKPNSTN